MINNGRIRSLCGWDPQGGRFEVVGVARDVENHVGVVVYKPWSTVDLMIIPVATWNGSILSRRGRIRRFTPDELGEGG